MIRRLITASVWFWGFWAFGSTLEFFRVAPSWPAVAVGVLGAVAILTVLGVGSSAIPAQSPQQSPEDAHPVATS